MKVLGAIWNGASDLLLMILEFFYGLTNSFGMAIVLLTIVVRIALYPLNQKQMVSMQQMQKIQPRLKVLQEKYANDKEKLNQETMRLYKENSQSGGMSAPSVQLPILILLSTCWSYDFANIFLRDNTALSTTAGLTGGGCSGRSDRKLRHYVGPDRHPAESVGLSNAGLYMGNLILLISISFLTWAQQKLSSAGANPQMAMMNTIMPFSWRSSAFRCPEELCFIGGFRHLSESFSSTCYEKDQR